MGSICVHAPSDRYVVRPGTQGLPDKALFFLLLRRDKNDFSPETPALEKFGNSMKD